MKTFLGYLTFAALLALCYIEKMNAEAAKNEIRLRTGGRNARLQARTWAERQLTVAQMRE